MKRLMTVAIFGLLLAACDGHIANPIAPGPIGGSSGAFPTSPNTATGGPTPIPGTPLLPAQRIEVTVVPGDPACFNNWDASGICRQLDFTAPTDGTLVATLSLPAPSRGFYDGDVFLVAPDGSWAHSSAAWPEKHVSLPATRGLTYRIVVMSYQPPETFTLQAEVR